MILTSYLVGLFSKELIKASITNGKEDIGVILQFAIQHYDAILHINLRDNRMEKDMKLLELFTYADSVKLACTQTIILL